MSTEQVDNNTNVVESEQSLDDFAAELFGGSKTAPDNAKSEESDNVTDGDTDATEELETEDTQTDVLSDEDVSEDDDTLATDEDEDPEEADEVAQKPKKKNRFQERIDELTAARREEERKRQEERLEYEKKIARLEAKLEGNVEDTKSETISENGAGLKAPNKDDKNPDGTSKYPLGEYDPQFLRDTVQHMFDVREAEETQKQQQTAQANEYDEARQALQGDWNTKLETARERYPDFQQKGEEMLSVFEGIDEQYGDYLTTTLMELDNGPDVFYYLSTNIDEAKEIVNAGAKKATIAIGKLSARLDNGNPESKKSIPAKRVSQAKEPPPQNKGSAVAAPAVALDTDDLDAFERVLFRKK